MVMTHPAHHDKDRHAMVIGGAGAVLGAVLLAAGGPAQADRSGAFEGTVERVWDDGFRLNAGSRQVTVDAYDLCGDFTHRHVAAGDRLKITGEFDGGELDVFTMVREDGGKVCG